jgi:hypothetical protein
MVDHLSKIKVLLLVEMRFALLLFHLFFLRMVIINIKKKEFGNKKRIMCIIYDRKVSHRGSLNIQKRWD